MLAATLRELAFPKQMHWDAWLDDGRGELLFGRPIRWILFLHGGRVVPFVVRRSVLAQSATVQEVRAGAVTYGHRVLAGSGRAGRALKVRSIADYRSKLGENFVLLDREERQSRVTRELDMHARRLGGRVNAAAVGQSGLLQEVVDLMEYPTVVAGTFTPDFLSLPEEVLTTTMIHHQHYFPVADESGKLMPAFLAVTNIQTDNARAISVNSERVLAARLRDAQFFWDADQKAPLESKLERLATLLFHKRLGSYRAKALRLEQLAGKIARDDRRDPTIRPGMRKAGRIAKADLTTDMVREFTELQGTMGGIYARREGQPEPVWKAICYQYLPVGVEPGQPPTKEQLGEGAVTWAALSIADKLDSVVGMFAAGERPTGTRDPLRHAPSGAGPAARAGGSARADRPARPTWDRVADRRNGSGLSLRCGEGSDRRVGEHPAVRGDRDLGERAARVLRRAPAISVRAAQLPSRRDQRGAAEILARASASEEHRAARDPAQAGSAAGDASIGRLRSACRGVQARQEHHQGRAARRASRERFAA